MITTDPREELVSRMVSTGNVSEEIARNTVASIEDDELVLTVLNNMRADEAERDALRKRLSADKVLSRAVCPEGTWKDAHARYDVAKRAVKLVEAAAEKASLEGPEVTATTIAQALIDLGGTIADTISMHGDDPRTPLWGNTTFYAFRYRLADAIAEVCTEVRREAERVRRAEEDASWARQGLERCERCGGAGGHSSWPGFVCYGCDGRRAVRPEDNRRGAR